MIVCMAWVSQLTLTARPCQRCIRKGLADQCVDGYRKKAKYLLEEDEIRMYSQHF